MYQHYNAIGTESLTPEELLDRQWCFFLDECDDEYFVKYLAEEWTEDLKEKGPVILERTEDWIEWCAFNPGLDDCIAQVLGQYLIHAFDKYKDAW